MSDLYKSKLISQLYNSSNSREIEDVLERIKDTNDLDFIYPIYDAYKRNKNKSFSHYFISSLDDFDSLAVNNILIEIAEDPQLYEDILIYTLSMLKTRKVYSKIIVEKVLSIFIKDINLIIEDRNTDKVEEYELSDILNYLEGAGEVGGLSDTLRSIFLSDHFWKNLRELVLEKFLRLNPNENLQYFLDNYQMIKGKESEILLTKQLIRDWKGSKTSKLIELIKNEGGERSKKIIASYEKEKQEKKEKEKEEKTEQDKKIEDKYNGKLVKELLEIIHKINESSQVFLLLSNNLFPSIEEITEQLKMASDRDSLIRGCLQLRTFLDKISKETKEHGFQYDQIKSLLPLTVEERDYEAPLNRLYLFLYSKQITTDFEIYGLRKLRKLFSKFGGHEAEQDHIDILKQLDLYEFYQASKWDELHKEILVIFKRSLFDMQDALLKAEKAKLNIQPSTGIL